MNQKSLEPVPNGQRPSSSGEVRRGFRNTLILSLLLLAAVVIIVSRRGRPAETASGGGVTAQSVSPAEGSLPVEQAPNSSVALRTPLAPSSSPAATPVHSGLVLP